MEKNQTIKCDVCECEHNDCHCNGCSLSSITVTPASDDQTTHYCSEFCHRRSQGSNR